MGHLPALIAAAFHVSLNDPVGFIPPYLANKQSMHKGLGSPSQMMERSIALAQRHRIAKTILDR